jgi:hypothetical protein
VFRGTTLALKVRCIGECARLRVATHGVGFVVEATLERTAAPSSAFSGPGGTRIAPAAEQRVPEPAPAPAWEEAA